MTKVKQAVIMVGGQGSRLMPFTKYRPKQSLPVLNKPIIRYLLESMAAAGIEEVILACGTGFRTLPLKEAIDNGPDIGLRIEYSNEEEPLGTGGAIKLVENRLDDVFVAANGDVFADILLKEQIDSHINNKADMTIALTKVKDEDRHKFGIAIVEEDGRITEFKEKPRADETSSNLANAGIYVINKNMVSLTEKKVFDLSKDLVPLMMEKQKRIQSIVLKGMWWDVGRPGDLLDVNLAMATKYGDNAMWEKRVRSSIIRRPFYLGEDSFVTDSDVSSAVILEKSRVSGSRLTKAMIMGNCDVVSATIKNSIIGAGCTIRPGAVIIDSDIEDGRTVGSGEKIEGERVKKD